MVGGTLPARKVMVVADPSRESAAALQYALSHAVVENDTLILLHVENPNHSTWRIPFSAIFRRPSNGSVAASPKNASTSIEGVIGAGGTNAGAGGEGTIDFLEAMKHACVIAYPNLKVQTENVGMDGKDKGSVILAQSTAHGVELLIVGQRTSLSNAILGSRRRSLRGLDTAEFLIQNSQCTCVAVQRKAMGGYLLNSKTHKNFWLLA
ncbi:OLC1v1019516C1 [Oldenlandia corymbosa var. corymbosa]|uniref:OLC1v1019516C1 n=1 Tax=Oldenlandia corymbosa var. corymbosa TaxID=529605 RepID=A0AAV1EE61_OLDCO|nr:OLC1v1019516C1 [Oldenlandia corymbosa var. corymbosa]